MMKIFRALLLLTLPFHFYLTTYSQVGYSPLVDSLIQEIHFDSLMLLDRQLSGDTSVVVGDETVTIASRAYNDPGNALAAQFIHERFQSYGLEVRMMNYDPDGQNVIATKTGYLYPEQQYIICAHYDSRPYAATAPGADDNASGVCGVLEAARLAGGTNFPYTLKFIAFDEEEPGLIGSLAYVDSAFANEDQILGVMNLDMLAWDSGQDYELSVSSNIASMPLLSEHMATMRIYRPELSPHMIYIGASDHYRFWARSYNALLTIEDRQDFNPYYHTVDDNYDHINKEYFHRLVQASVATFLTWATGSRMQLQHESLTTEAVPAGRLAELVVESTQVVFQGNDRARMYYRVDGGPFEYINPFSQWQDTLRFQMPSFPYGSTVEYYFAVQDSTGSFVSTLPHAGKGVNPPGSIPPPRLYRYSILKDTSAVYCATGLPQTIVPQDTTFMEIPVATPGRLLDVNVRMSINHSSTWDLDIYLLSPSGQQVELSSRNGYNFDNYTSTVFDDEASQYIHENRPPYTGSFIPEFPLSDLDDQNVSGNWALMVVNRGTAAGQLIDFCLELEWGLSDLYVDAAVSSSGDGLSWTTALQTLTEACLAGPQPGQAVFIKPGTYSETLMITSNGEETVPLATGIEVLDTNVIQFPATTDLSGIDLVTHPGEYLAYVFGSGLRNNGFYTVIGIDEAQKLLWVEDAMFLPETGLPGDTNQLSCAVGRPVVYKKVCADPENERVVLDATNLSMSNSILYIGDSIGNGMLDALPANFNIIDGIDLTGASAGSGLHLQSSSFNIIRNSSIYEIAGTGIHIGGNNVRCADHNFIVNNIIYNALNIGIQVGNEEQPNAYNHACYNYLVDNELFVEGSGPNAFMEKAIQVWDHNRSTVISDHYIHDISLISDNTSLVQIFSGTDGTLVYGNSFRNITGPGPGTNSVIEIHGYNTGVSIYNNIIANIVPVEDGLYSFNIEGSGTTGCMVVHNTIFQMDRGFLLKDFSSIPDFHIQNNIVDVIGNCYSHQGQQGRFTVSNNLYFDDPAPDSSMAYFGEEGKQVGEVEFVNAGLGDFHLCTSSYLAVCRGVTLQPFVSIDPDRNLRDQEDPDIGAYELDEKVVWEGNASSSWSDPANWRSQQVPGPGSIVVIAPAAIQPVAPAGQITVDGLIIMPDAQLHLTSGTSLVIEED